MKKLTRLTIAGALLALGLGPAAPPALAATQPAATAPGAQTLNGTLPDGATWKIEVPANWNGTLFLYSHGYVTPGSANPAADAGDPLTAAAMLAQGFALAGSSYATTGWAIQQALPDQIATLDAFDQVFGAPARTIAWGHSLGGIITAPSANLNGAIAAAAAAQQTPRGRARLALAAALGDTPGWFAPLSPEPAATDYAAQEANQFSWDTQVDFPFIFAFRAELEARAGGNPSWNTGVNYFRDLAKSADLPEVVALYRAAGLSLGHDLQALDRATRISAVPSAMAYLARNIVFTGRLPVPVLTIHTTGDELVVPENEQAYRSAVERAGDGSLLQQIFVDRAGHCAFTPAETITAVQVLAGRLPPGRPGRSPRSPPASRTPARSTGPWPVRRPTTPW
jgi:dienelactone hydrolase